jgi:Cu-Zn family superoxide dismutase
MDKAFSALGLALALAIAIGLAVCTVDIVGAAHHEKGEKAEGTHGEGHDGPVKKAVCVLEPTTENTASGQVDFEQVEGGVSVHAHLSGLEPGAHGFHIHQWGNCSSGDGKSAGGHYNPHGKDHAGPDSDVKHVGDLGNIVAEADGTAHYEATIKGIYLNGPNGILGRGMIVHAGTDDLTSQPTGDAGGRVACGVIGAAE